MFIAHCQAARLPYAIIMGLMKSSAKNTHFPYTLVLFHTSYSALKCLMYVFSVSAERWINVEEVRPGRPLKEYLLKKKEEGYAVVAAEQTSSSTKLQTFKFPKKTLLLLG